MLLLYRIIIWSLLVLVGSAATGLLPLPILETNTSWLGQFLYYLAGYCGFEIIWYVQKRYQLEISPHIFLWLVVAMAHGIPGAIFGLFTRYAWYDQVTHSLLMGTALAAIVYQYVKGFLAKAHLSQPLLLWILVVSITTTLGVCNEIMEYALDVMHGNQTPLTNVGDTANDLLMNSLGVTLYVVIVFVRNAFSKRGSVVASQ